MRASTFALGLLIVAVGGGGGWWWMNQGSASTPKQTLLFEPDPIEFGEVPFGEAPVRRVTITNLGARDVFLRNPRFSCSCFALVNQVPALVRRGQTVDFEFRLWTAMTTAGRFRKELTIETDDPLAGTVKLPIVGAIVDYRTVAPNPLVLGRLEPGGEPLEKTIEVRGGQGFVATATEATSTDARLSTELRAVDGGTNVVVRTTANPTKGWISTHVVVTLEVGLPGAPTRRYTERVAVTGEVR